MLYIHVSHFLGPNKIHTKIKVLKRILAKIFFPPPPPPQKKNLRTSPSHEIRSTILGLECDKFAKDENNGNMHQSDKLDLRQYSVVNNRCFISSLIVVAFLSGLHTSNSCWPTPVVKLKLVCVNNTTCWQTVGKNRDKFCLSPTVCQHVVVSFTHTNLSFANTSWSTLV